ncbi:MAG: hypothetical protein KA087_04775 [Candidatus Saccharicenans sp.]|jgi:hypothetical protein|nr:hypothetical protein [Candidatus Saccharicenans sp.]
MNESIERLDQKRKGALKTYVLGGLLFYGAWIFRFILRETGHLTDALDYAIAVPFAIGVIILLYSFVRVLQVRRAMEKNPEFMAALDDERVRINILLAFKFGFFAILAGLIFFAVFNFFSPIKDVNAIFIGLLLLGAFAYVLKFYILERD